MNIIEKAVAELREAADRLESRSAKLIWPDESYNLHSAVAKLQAALPSQWMLQIKLNAFGGGKVEVEFVAWDGKDNHAAMTLDAAVNNALVSHAARHTPPPVEPVDKVQQLLELASPVPEMEF